MSRLWISAEEQMKWNSWLAKQERRLWFLMRPLNWEVHFQRVNSKEDTGKLAYIQVGQTKRMAYVTKDQQTAYKMQGMYERTNVKWSKFTFIRWCTSFDT
jgi:hypothetical protein